MSPRPRADPIASSSRPYPRSLSLIPVPDPCTRSQIADPRRPPRSPRHTNSTDFASPDAIFSAREEEGGGGGGLACYRAASLYDYSRLRFLPDLRENRGKKIIKKSQTVETKQHALGEAGGHGPPAGGGRRAVGGRPGPARLTWGR